jgi:hypothetical protein
MGRVSNGRLAELWRGRIGRQARSGLSIREYCRREGVSAGSYYLWKRRLSRQPVPEVRRGNSARPTVAETPNSQSGFVEVAWTSSQVIEVYFTDGTLLKVPANQPDALAVTLKTLRAAGQERHAHD